MWLHNRAGRLVLVSRSLHPARGFARAPVVTVISADDVGDLIERPHLRCDATRCAVLYVARSARGIIYTDLEGRPITRPATVASLTEPVRIVGFEQGTDGLRFLTYRREATDLTVYRASEDGVLEDGSPWVLPDALAGEGWPDVDSMIATDDGWGLLWSDRRSDHLHDVLLTRLSSDFRRVVRTRVLFQSRGAARFIGPELEPRVVLFVDGAGIELHRVERGVEPVRIAEETFPQVSALRDDAGPRVALVYSTGEYQPNNPLPTGLAFLALDYGSEQVGPPVEVTQSATCIESGAMAVRVATDRLGVAWVSGCGVRRLWLAELRAFRAIGG